MPRRFAFISAFALIAALAPVAPAQALSTDVVISQVYGGGGNTGATYTHDFVELFNRGATPVSLAGMSVQYATATGTQHFGLSVTVLSGGLAPGQHYLVQLAQGAGGSVPLPTPDATGTTAMSNGSGKVALVNSTTGLACNGGSTPCSPAQLALIKDLVGYGAANFYEGPAAAPTLSNTTAALRLVGGCTETDNNSTDFSVGPPNPRNTATALSPCSGPDAAPTVASTEPVDGATDVPLNSNLMVTFSEPVNVAASWFTLGCSSSGKVMATVTGGPITFALDPSVDLVNGESCTLTVVAAQVSDQDSNDPPDAMVSDHLVTFATPPPLVKSKQAQTAASPPTRIKKRGVTVLTTKNALTNAGLRVATKVTGKGKGRAFKVIRSKGAVKVRTFGKKSWRLVLVQSAPATETYNAYRLRTVYVNGRRR